MLFSAVEMASILIRSCDLIKEIDSGCVFSGGRKVRSGLSAGKYVKLSPMRSFRERVPRNCWTCFEAASKPAASESQASQIQARVRDMSATLLGVLSRQFHWLEGNMML